ncbi:hypothetical protein FALBO_2294 [Fusarium albosuccineum]|uniref:C2H2-type domain-containing protein n=1 Tax=Fusarium albosuccineum TaxID=1237068 RepID=A0A8H4LMG2_9HYPO|nr:hypothetical protein FALBO_2294 [Fusarium albosuccineum]
MSDSHTYGYPGPIPVPPGWQIDLASDSASDTDRGRKRKVLRKTARRDHSSPLVTRFKNTLADKGFGPTWKLPTRSRDSSAGPQDGNKIHMGIVSPDTEERTRPHIIIPDTQGLEEVALSRGLTGRTLVNWEDSVIEDDFGPYMNISNPGQNLTIMDDKFHNEARLRGYFSDSHSRLQISSKIRQLVVSLNPALRSANHYLADRIAYHYAGRVHALDQWQHPLLGIQGLHESKLFEPFVCTWESCGPKSFGSVEEWRKHIQAHRYDWSAKKIVDMSNSLTCKFCGTMITLTPMDDHVAKHLVTIGQAFLDGSWRSIEADPGASLGQWQRKPVELQAIEIKSVAPQSHKTSYYGKSISPLRAQAEEIQAMLAPSISDTSAAMAQSAQRPKFKQIGIAQVQVKMVISPHLMLPTSTDDRDDDSGDDSWDESDLQDADYVGGSNTTGGGGWSTNLPGSSSMGLGAGTPSFGGGSGPGGEDQGDDGRRRKRRRGQKELNTLAHRLRFACPYQAFEPETLDCFKRGPHNRQGGCENLYRLRQHLARRHMRSYRCGSCWRSFDNSSQRDQHVNAYTCEPRLLPEFERLMSPHNEFLVNQPRPGMSDVDAWWAIFKLLIPDMGGRDVDSLKLQYSPHYVHRDTSIMIPAINIPDSIFEEISSQPIGSPSGILNSVNMDFATDPNAAQSNPTAFVSQDFSVPVFQLSDPPGLGNMPEITVSASGSPSVSSMAASSDQSSHWAQHGRSTPATSAASLRSVPTSVTGGASQTQLERHLVRLKAQYKHVETENKQLRDDKSANRQDLEGAEELLESVLRSAELSQEAFEKLGQASDILLGMKRRLV